MRITVIPLAAALAASMLWAGRSDAQVRIGGGVRVATPRRGVSVVVGRPYYYRPFYYRPYYQGETVVYVKEVPSESSQEQQQAPPPPGEQE